MLAQRARSVAASVCLLLYTCVHRTRERKTLQMKRANGEQTVGPCWQDGNDGNEDVHWHTVGMVARARLRGV